MALKADLVAAAEQLAEAGIDNPEVDAQLLAAHLMGVSLGEVQAKVVLDIETPDRFQEFVALRAQRIPLQHLTGTAAFRYLSLSVGPGVFIPRPETELVAQAAIDETLRLHQAQASTAASTERVVVVDLCTGSAAIACAVATETSGAEVYAVENSLEAHAWAERNCAGVKAETSKEIHLIHHDATTVADGDHPLAGLRGKVDVVVSNPPYIPRGQVPLDPEVRDHDPDAALYGGDDSGLAIPRAVARTAALLLRSGGMLVMEHGHGQQSQLLNHLRSTGWTDLSGHRDYADKERYVTARRSPGQQ